MPHMANLSWIPLFSIFNSTLLVIYCTMNFPTSFFNSPTISKNKKNSSKWQW